MPGSIEIAMTGAYLERQGLAPISGTPGLEDVLGALTKPLERHEHLLASGYSTADVLVGSTLAALRPLGVALPTVLDAYVDRLSERPAFQRASGATSEP